MICACGTQRSTWTLAGTGPRSAGSTSMPSVSSTRTSSVAERVRGLAVEVREEAVARGGRAEGDVDERRARAAPPVRQRRRGARPARGSAARPGRPESSEARGEGQVALVVGALAHADLAPQPGERLARTMSSRPAGEARNGSTRRARARRPPRRRAATRTRTTRAGSRRAASGAPGRACRDRRERANTPAKISEMHDPVARLRARRRGRAPRSGRSARPAGRRRPRTASLARATCAHEECGAANSTSCPARLHASANGTSGPMCPAPRVLARRMRMSPKTPRRAALFRYKRVEDVADQAGRAEEQEHAR